MKKRAFITGIAGQDGYYMAQLLNEKDYEIFGLAHSPESAGLKNFPEDLRSRITVVAGDVGDATVLGKALEQAQPDEIYHFAAISDLGTAIKYPEETMRINFGAVQELLNQALTLNPKVRIAVASSAEIFDKSIQPQSETTPFKPLNPYGEAKLKAHLECVVKNRNERGAFACSAFLFNHESPRREERFVTRKITKSLVKIQKGLQDVLELGNLDAKRDWGFAGDYVKAMWLMLQQDTPDDFVIATGHAHTVREFVEAAAQALDMPITWEGSEAEEVGKDEKGKVIVRVNPEFYRPLDTAYPLGDISKAKKILGWNPEVSFNELVAMMVKRDLEELAS